MNNIILSRQKRELIGKDLFDKIKSGCGCSKEINLENNNIAMKGVNPKLVQGTIISTFGDRLKDAHILNNRTGDVVVSDDKGHFKTNALPTDELEISHVSYKSRKVKASIFPKNGASISLNTNVLEDVEIIAIKKPKKCCEKHSWWILTVLGLSIGGVVYYKSKKGTTKTVIG